MSGTEPRVPSVGGDPRERPGDVTDPPGKIWFRDLDEAVIEADRCVQCASCVAACPSDSIGIDENEGRPTLVRMCTGCSSCWDYCPRSGLRYESLIHRIRGEHGFRKPLAYTVRAKTETTRAHGQDGGAVTELLIELIERNELDGALVAREDPQRPLRGEATIATTAGALREAAGSIYNQTMGLGQIEDLLNDSDGQNLELAIVGPPCVIHGASALERFDHSAAAPFALTVALMCTRSFDYDRLIGRLSEFDVDVESIEKLDVTDGDLYAFGESGEVLLKRSVDTFESARLRGCDECADFLGKSADLSAGSIGSSDGRTTLLVQTERGERAWEIANDALDYLELDSTDALARIADWNERRAIHHLQREYDPDGSIGISRYEHVTAYEGTNRGPEPFNPARVHQYEEWC